jgi:hypothetical protein
VVPKERNAMSLDVKDPEARRLSQAIAREKGKVPFFHAPFLVLRYDGAMETLLAERGQFKRTLVATPHGKYYIAHVDLSAPEDGVRPSVDMTEQELRYELRQEGYSDDAIDAALEAARAALKT